MAEAVAASPRNLKTAGGGRHTARWRLSKSTNQQINQRKLEMRIDIGGGVRLFVDVEGPGLVPDGPLMREKPTLICMHGGPGFDHSAFKPGFSCLADIAQIVYYDHRGHGRSDARPPSEWTLDTWADDVVRLSDALGLVKPIVLGQSFGGFVAQRYIARHPGHASKVILSSTSPNMVMERKLAMFEKLGGPPARELARQFWNEPTPAHWAAYWAGCRLLYNTTLPRDPAAAQRTLVREDIFAGILTNDLDRLSRREKSVELLLTERPKAKAPLLSCKGGIALYRSVVANEGKRDAEFELQYRQALELFSEANRLADPGDLGVAAVSGAGLLLFGDRLPERYRAAAYAAAYDAYNALWKVQSGAVDKMPLHSKGELLAGLAQSAQRTGRAEESSRYLDQILASLPGTPYESRAKAWKARPEMAGRSSLNCQTCHEGGRLAARTAALAK